MNYASIFSIAVTDNEIVENFKIVIFDLTSNVILLKICSIKLSPVMGKDVLEVNRLV